MSKMSDICISWLKLTQPLTRFVTICPPLLEVIRKLLFLKEKIDKTVEITL